MAQAIIDSLIFITRLRSTALLLPLKRSAIMLKVLPDYQSFDYYLSIREAVHHLSKLICHSHQLFAQLVERDL